MSCLHSQGFAFLLVKEAYDRSLCTLNVNEESQRLNTKMSKFCHLEVSVDFFFQYIYNKMFTMIFFFLISRKHFFEQFRRDQPQQRESGSIVSQEFWVLSGICSQARLNTPVIKESVFLSSLTFPRASLAEAIVQRAYSMSYTYHTLGTLALGSLLSVHLTGLFKRIGGSSGQGRHIVSLRCWSGSVISILPSCSHSLCWWSDNLQGDLLL